MPVIYGEGREKAVLRLRKEIKEKELVDTAKTQGDEVLQNKLEHDNLDRQTKSKILRDISTQPYGAHHKAVTKDRLPELGQWLLEHESYQAWRRESTSSVLWLHGMPGCGKSKLVSLVIDDVRETDRVAFFYCTRNPAEPQRAECDKILASLVRQLACLSVTKPILPPVLLQYESAVEELGEFEDQNWSVKRMLQRDLKSSMRWMK
jgi:hypothetical protein